MKKIYIFLLCIPLLLISCGKPTQDVGTALFDFTQGYDGLSRGNLYQTANGGISMEEVLLLYDPTGGLSDGVLLSAALYLGASFDEVTELAVFDCAGSDAAIELTELCRRRAELLRQFDGDLQYTVLRYGEYIFFAALPSIQGVERLADRIFA